MADPIITFVLATLAYLGAMFWGAVALLRWMAHRRVPRFSLSLAGASLLFALVCTVVMPPGYSEREARRIDRAHAEFAPVLETYRRQHGAYPPTLEAAGIPTPRTRYGPLRYSAEVGSAGVPQYHLGFGD
jgi:hypothetical protein